MKNGSLPVAFIPHGGGPCFFMDWDPPDTWTKMGDWLRGWAATLPQTPRAILVISGHWEEENFTVMANPQPPLIYDYSGFPAHTYQLTYDAPGAPDLAAHVQHLLVGAGIPCDVDETRGYDHGVFIPFKLIYPDAQIPVIQLSLKSDLDPTACLAVGRALAPLREQGVLIVGSGMSYHNLRAFMSRQAGKTEASQRFDDWLTDTLVNSAERDAKLTHWERAPSARDAHPREEHLLPLMVVAGAAVHDTAYKVFSDNVMGAVVSAFQFG